MKALFTGDWQAEFDNLPQLRLVVQEMLSLCQKNGVQVVVHCGDVKKVYNPIDGKVVNFFVQEVIPVFLQRGIRFCINLGNHDRLGLYVDKENWFPLLRKAGAVCFDEPGVHSLGDCRLLFLPFCTSDVLFERWALRLSQIADDRSVLVFHTDLNNARYNVLTSSPSRLTAQMMYPEKYQRCIGGHIHLQQQVAGASNVFYVGSPFATDWGEANQKKGYLLLDLEKKTLLSIPSSLPGMYDPSWPRFKESTPKSWTGSKIRLHVPCDGSVDVVTVLEHARLAGEKKYPGASVLTIPEFKDKVETKVILGVDDSDEDKVRAYVEQTCPLELVEKKLAIVRYLTGKLSQAGGIPAVGSGLQVQMFQAQNFLSFKELSFKYQPGLTVISGENEDWSGHSNGSGKTSFLQPPAVAWFGLTFKGQKHDAWMRRGIDKKEKSWVSIWFKDRHGRSCRVVRGRKPKALRIWVNGKEVGAGNRPEQAQELVSQLTGFSWDTLANSVYVDQRKENLMLTGTESERKQFLSKLQGLERFERALSSVKEARAQEERKIQELTWAVGGQKSLLSDAEETLQTLEKETPNVAKLRQELATKNAEITKRKAKAEELKKGLATTLAEINRQDDALASSAENLLNALSNANAEYSAVSGRLERLRTLSGPACPTCSQKIDRVFATKLIQELAAEKKVLWSKVDGLSLQLSGIRNDQFKIRESRRKFDLRIVPVIEHLEKLSSDAEACLQELKQAGKQEQKILAAREKVRVAKSRLYVDEKVLKTFQDRRILFDYFLLALSRKGMPAFLNAQLCPLLNSAAQVFSKLFSENEIQVRFSVNEEGESDVQVVNAHGGEQTDDQSQGEMKIASLITSFALRQMAPKTNLLIIDEPGEGLDAKSARMFARGLQEVVPMFGCVLLTTHNPAILSELAGSRQVIIKKKNRVSCLVGG